MNIWCATITVKQQGARVIREDQGELQLSKMLPAADELFKLQYQDLSKQQEESPCVTDEIII